MIAILKIGKAREVVVQGSEEEIADCVKQHAMGIIHGGGEGTLTVTIPTLAEPVTLNEVRSS